MSKNIKEYVVENVLKMLGEREQELEEIKRIMEDLDVIKCGFCKCYRKYDLECEFCGIKSCENCEKVDNYKSWNLFGCDCCDECYEKYCVLCRKLRTDCKGKGMAMCK
jgi:hypothetical protein